LVTVVGGLEFYVTTILQRPQVSELAMLVQARDVSLNNVLFSDGAWLKISNSIIGKNLKKSIAEPEVFSCSGSTGGVLLEKHSFIFLTT